jgi:hypothetical protein
MESMSGLSRELSALGGVIHETKIAKGWTVTTPESWPDPNQVPADLCLIHSEVSDGLAHGLDIDLGAVVRVKVEQNRARAYKHGGKRL